MPASYNGILCQAYILKTAVRFCQWVPNETIDSLARHAYYESSSMALRHI